MVPKVDLFLMLLTPENPLLRIPSLFPFLGAAADPSPVQSRAEQNTHLNGQLVPSSNNKRDNLCVSPLPSCC